MRLKSALPALLAASVAAVSASASASGEARAAESPAAAATPPEPELASLPRLPGLSPGEALKALRAAPGWEVSLAAAEPVVVDPVAMSFDDKGALYVAEMRDYSERRAEKLSRIRKLVDRDRDGVFESSTVYMEGLAWVTGVLWHRGAVYVAATPDIWKVEDTDGDGIADRREVIFTGFGAGRARLNVQALVNSLTPGPDGRIYAAGAGNGGIVRRPEEAESAGTRLEGRDFSFDPVTLERRSLPGGGQYGLTFDRFGRRFTCSNSHHIQWAPDVPSGGYLTPPPALWDIAPDGPAAPVFRISPDEPWRVTRTNWRASGLVEGIVEGNGKPSGYFTSASGIHIWRDCAIVADCGSNLVHRKRFRETPDGPVAERPPGERDREFLASTDTWFRPVSFTTAPDGSLLIADMCREYIEHPDSLPPPLKRLMDLNSGNDRGRIWRVRPSPSAPGPAPEPEKPDALLCEILAASPEEAAARRPRWWTGSTAADRPRSPLADVILAGLRDREEASAFYDRCAPALTVRQALFLLARLRLPAPPILSPRLRHMALSSGALTPERREAMAVLAPEFPEDIRAIALNRADDPAAREVALRLSPSAAEAMADRWAEEPAALRAAAVEALAAAPGGPEKLLRRLREKTLLPGEIPLSLAAAWRRDSALTAEATELLPAPSRNRAAVIAARQAALTLTGSAAAGGRVFAERCALCHRDGETGAAVGPDRVSFRNKGKPLLYAAILDPDAEVAPQYTRVTVTRKDGTLVTGVSGGESADALTVLPPGGVAVAIPRAEITAMERDAASLMPAGLDEGLSDQDFADLLEWLVR